MTPARDSRKMRWFLVLSVALNLFFAAFLGAQAWRVHHDIALPEVTRGSVASGMIADIILRRLVGRLPPEDGRVLREAMAPRMPEIIRLQRQSSQALERIRTDIVSNPFDVDRTRADMMASREARQKISPLIEESLLDALPRMSDEGRRVLSEYRLFPRR